MRLCCGWGYKDDAAETETEQRWIWLERCVMHIATGAP